MELKELFKKIYNREITKEDVIIKKDKTEEEYDAYILNNGYDFWYKEGDDVISLNFFKKDDNYEYEIISLKEFQIMMEKTEKEKRIEELKRELEILQG